MQSAHDTTTKFAGLFTTYLVICSLTVVLVAVVVLGVAWRFRARTGRTPQQAKDHRLLLGGYAVVLIVIAAFLLSATFSVENNVDSTSAPAPVTVLVVASQWRWTFSYAGHPGVQTIDSVTVPAGRVVRFRMRSADVIHSIWFVRQRFKRYAIPGSPTQFELEFPDKGTFRGECAQFCGIGHDDMRFVVHVVGAAAFRHWISLKAAAR